MIETLTLEQRHQLSRDRHKSRKRWNRILRSTEPIDRAQASAAIAQVYAHLGLAAPRILFFPSPDAAWNAIQQKLLRQRWPTRLLGQISTSVTAICMGSGCLCVVLIFPFLLLYGLLRQINFLAGLLNFVAAAIGLSALLVAIAGVLMVLLNPLTEAIEQFEQKHNRDRVRRELGLRLTPHFTTRLIEPIQRQLAQQIAPALWDEIKDAERFFRSHNAQQIWHHLDRPIKNEWQSHYGRFFEPFQPNESQYCFDFPIAFAGQVEVYNFCRSVLGCEIPLDSWQALHHLLQTCSLILPFEQVCFLCDRPTRVSIDSKNRLHGSIEPAVQFADGSGLYFNRGTRIPQPQARSISL